MNIIPNAGTKYFRDKEHYLEFRQAWKNYHKEGKHRTQPKEDHYGATHKVSDLRCVHHFIYALLRGRDLSKIFAPITEHKLGGGQRYRAFYAAKRTLRWYSTMRDKERGAFLFAPFGNTLTDDMLAMLGEDISDMQME